MLEKHLRNTFLLYLVVEILQLVHEISSFPEFPGVLYKRGDLSNFSKLTDEHKKQSSGGFLSKDILKSFVNFTEKHICWSLFFNNVAGWKAETVRSSRWRCSKKKGILKKAHWCFRTSRS